MALPNCADCGKHLSHPKAKRCRSCAQRERWTRPDDPRIKRDCIEFEGTNYYLDGRDGYYRSSNCVGRGLLHRAVWEAAYGPIPNDKEIHHGPGGKGDNSLPNLFCLTRLEHVRVEPRGQAIVEASFEQRSEWARASWVNRQPTARPCKVCGETFMSRAVRAFYCSNPCRDRARRYAATQ